MRREARQQVVPEPQTDDEIAAEHDEGPPKAAPSENGLLTGSCRNNTPGRRNG